MSPSPIAEKHPVVQNGATEASRQQGSYGCRPWGKGPAPESWDKGPVPLPELTTTREYVDHGSATMIVLLDAKASRNALLDLCVLHNKKT